MEAMTYRSRPHKVVFSGGVSKPTKWNHDKWLEEWRYVVHPHKLCPRSKIKIGGRRSWVLEGYEFEHVIFTEELIEWYKAAHQDYVIERMHRKARRNPKHAFKFKFENRPFCYGCWKHEFKPGDEAIELITYVKQTSYLIGKGKWEMKSYYHSRYYTHERAIDGATCDFGTHLLEIDARYRQRLKKYHADLFE